jgi:hypothetical protein
LDLDSLRAYRAADHLPPQRILYELPGANDAPLLTGVERTLHLEFRVPYQPQDRGQGRGNSGCYVQGRYEVQILDSFGLDSKDNDCGGIYSVSAPALNMSYPPLAWQTYDIDFVAARYDAQGQLIAAPRITVRHNGVVIHRDVELKKVTPGGVEADGPGPGPLHLQDHGNPVRFRNIWFQPRN